MPFHPKNRAALSVLPLALLLTSCAGKIVEPITPPAERLASVPFPVVPDGEVACPDDPAAQCLSDQENARLIAGLAAALLEANSRLAWLRDYLKGGRSAAGVEARR